VDQLEPPVPEVLKVQQAPLAQLDLLDYPDCLATLDSQEQLVLLDRLATLDNQVCWQ